MTKRRPLGPSRTAVAVSVALVAALSACTGASSPMPTGSAAGVGASSAMVAKARAGGASEEQLAILAKSAVPSFEDYEAAVNGSLACIQDAGIGTPAVVRDEQGVIKLGYGYEASSPGRSDAQTDEVAQACIRQHSRWIEEAWMTQPLALEWEDQQIEALRPVYIACLKAYGVEVDESWTTEEVQSRISDLAREKGATTGATSLKCPDGFAYSVNE